MKKIILFIFSLAVALPVGAAEEPKMIGWAPWFGSLSVSDPAGDTASEGVSLPLSAMFVIPGKRDRRWVFTGFGYDFRLPASTTNIGQSVKGFSLAGWYQFRFRLSRSFKPWLGIGLQADMLDINARHKVDSDGFLAVTYPDRKETNYALVLNLSQEWNISHDFNLGVNAQYLASISDSLSGPLVGVSLLYRLK